MNTRRLTAALLALMMTASLCGCGDDPVAEERVSEDVAVMTVTTAAETEAAETESSAAETAAAETESAATEITGEAPASENELAEVQRVADIFIKASEDHDYEAMLDVYDVALLYYLENGELGSREQYLEFLKKNEEIREETSEIPLSVETEYGAPVCANDEAESYNEFFRKVDDISRGETALAELFKVDGVYELPLRVNGTNDVAGSADDSGIKADFSFTGSMNLEVPVAILRVNGEWKVDPAIGITKGLYDVFMQLGDDDDDDSGSGFRFSVNGESVFPDSGV